MVIASHCDHAAPRGGSSKISVLENIARAINAGRLAVPEPKHPVITRAVKQINLLRAPNGGGGQVLI